MKPVEVVPSPQSIAAAHPVLEEGPVKVATLIAWRSWPSTPLMVSPPVADKEGTKRDSKHSTKGRKRERRAADAELRRWSGYGLMIGSFAIRGKGTITDNEDL
jgi:hypothetical protein